MLTTAVETWGRSWTLGSASMPYDLVSSPVVDGPGLAKPPEKRKVGGSTPPLTTGSISVATMLTCPNADEVPGSGDIWIDARRPYATGVSRTLSYVGRAGGLEP